MFLILGTNLWKQPLWYVNCQEHAKLDIIDTVKRNVRQGSLDKWTERFTPITFTLSKFNTKEEKPSQ